MPPAGSLCFGAPDFVCGVKPHEEVTALACHRRSVGCHLPRFYRYWSAL